MLIRSHKGIYRAAFHRHWGGAFDRCWGCLGIPCDVRPKTHQPILTYVIDQTIPRLREQLVRQAHVHRRPIWDEHAALKYTKIWENQSAQQGKSSNTLPASTKHPEPRRSKQTNKLNNVARKGQDKQHPKERARYLITLLFIQICRS